MLLDIVKRNMIYKNLETVSDLIQRNEKRDNKQKKLFFTDISKQRFIVLRYSNLLLMKQQLSFYNPCFSNILSLEDVSTLLDNF